MKKSVLRTAALFLALTLSSCSTLMDGAVNDPTEPPAPVTTPTEGEGDVTDSPTEPTGPVATGYDQYGFTLWPEGNYLADPKFDTDEYLPDFDADVSFVQYASTMRYAAAVTEDTIYTFPYDVVTGKTPPVLLFTDRITGITLPLCGKPECTHDDSTCNAYVAGGQARGLRVYDGKLWWVQEEIGSLKLTCMDLDATNRKTAAELDLLDRKKLANHSAWVIHRGYLYVGGQNPNVVVNGEAGSSFTVYAKPLDGGEGFTILDRIMVSCSNALLSMKPMGNDLYVTLCYNTARGNDQEQVYCYELYRWDSKTRKSECLLKIESEEPLFNSMTFPLPVPKDGIYFVNSVTNNEDGVQVEDYTVLKYSFETGEFGKYSTFSVENGGSVRLTREHIVALSFGEEYRMRVFDREGAFLFKSGPLPDGFQGIALMGEDSENVYFECLDAQSGQSFILAVPLDGEEFLVIQ